MLISHGIIRGRKTLTTYNHHHSKYHKNNKEKINKKRRDKEKRLRKLKIKKVVFELSPEDYLIFKDIKKKLNAKNKDFLPELFKLYKS